MELQITRIPHESLSNVIRHATASHVSVLLQGNQDRFCIKIHDNGRGFNPDEVSSERLGLQIMRERAMSVGREFSIESSSEFGTSIV
jgi:signal transduction histidine kinase